MKFLLVVGVVVLGACWGRVQGVCRFPPSLWCSSPEIASECGVLEQCRLSQHKDMTAGPVNFTLYYESLCPDCRDFFNRQLFKTWMMLAKDSPEVVNIELVPYGNAREQKVDDKWVFQCQHGNHECFGNLVETCAIKMLKNISVYFPFVACMELLTPLPEATFEICAKRKGKFDVQILKDCIRSDAGNAYEHEMAVKTNALQPPHKYVPWITINGVHTEDIQKQAESDLTKLICDTYKGPTPKACEALYKGDKHMRSYVNGL